VGVLLLRDLNLNLLESALNKFALGMCGQVTTPTVPAEITKEICSGCQTYKYIDKKTEEVIYCCVPAIIKEQICPCSKCILKMVCQEICLKFDNYIYKKRGEI
jgi:hypothetical protein